MVAGFRVGGKPLSIQPFGSGHINDTYVSLVDTPRGPQRFVHQRINDTVFRSPRQVIQNIERVTNHIRDKLALQGRDPSRRVLALIPTVHPGADGESVLRSPEGEVWRTYRYIDGATTHDIIRAQDHARSVARAFGPFQKQVGDLPGPRLHETIPHFADTQQRFKSFLAALDADARNRAIEARPEIEFALKREHATSLIGELLAARRIPERIVHNDTKINNVMIDDVTGEGICVIDLDTVMPGTTLYDFGDMVRMGASSAAEDEPNLSIVGLDMRLFESLVEGYLGATREFLTRGEMDHLVDAARIVALTIGVRFLSDFLSGDTYFKTLRPGHNLDRCRTQFAMVRTMEDVADDMHAIVDRYRG
jgi:Ser/Thr protein kinase RdoA (MazF antagonist)